MKLKHTPEAYLSRLKAMRKDRYAGEDLSPNDKDAIAWALTELERLPNVVRKLGGFAATVRQENSDEWMQLMADAINRACAAIGDSDRFKPAGDVIAKELSP